VHGRFGVGGNTDRILHHRVLVQSCCIHVSPVRLLCRSSALITSYLLSCWKICSCRSDVRDQDL
jgi:hypothetical protein